MKKVAVIDTKAGNLFSIFSCVRRIGFEPELIQSAEQISQKEFVAMIIPGQGRFGTVMSNLRSSQLDKVIIDWYQSDKKIIGICVGMQIFFEWSAEDLDNDGLGIRGLGLVKGTVTKLKSPKQPMVGWCEIDASISLLQQKTVYFVNSYAVKSSENEIATTYYGEQFVAAIQSKGLMAFQFHPEKSGSQGEEILQQCLTQ
ncbi:MAG: imidazole glycerol phosphate synthase subunit HisH [Kangiellaceae bacterium]|nr:imidazole glycerol phosphate synthase subunit HisH [Kangiellaceae bacterium]